MGLGGTAQELGGTAVDYTETDYRVRDCKALDNKELEQDKRGMPVDWVDRDNGPALDKLA